MVVILRIYFKQTLLPVEKRIKRVKRNKAQKESIGEIELQKKKDEEVKQKENSKADADRKEGEGEDDDEEPFTFTEVEEIYSIQKDDPFFDIIDERNQARLTYMQLPTKVELKPYIDGMNALLAPKIPRSITGSNPQQENQSDVFYRRESNFGGGVRLNNRESDSEEEVDSKQNMRSIDAYGASIIDITGQDNSFSGPLQAPNLILDSSVRKASVPEHLDRTSDVFNLENRVDVTNDQNISVMDVTDPDIGFQTIK